MGAIKNITIKIENREALTLDEFNVAKESGLNGVRVFNFEKGENEYFIVDWKDEEIVVDGELINTYGGDFVYRDVTAKMTDDNLFTLWEKQYGQCDDCGELEIDDDSDIKQIALGF